MGENEGLAVASSYRLSVRSDGELTAEVLLKRRSQLAVWNAPR